MSRDFQNLPFGGGREGAYLYATKNSGYITGHQNSGRGKYFCDE
jgi:hypothetical protein